MLSGSAERTTKADLANSFEDRNESHVRNSNRSHEKGYTPEEKKQRVQVALHAGSRPSRLRGSYDFQTRRFRRIECDWKLPRYHLGRADARLDLHRPGCCQRKLLL